jgi:hypothetical protein
MRTDVRVSDAATAGSVAKHYLKSQKKMIEIKVIRTWPPRGKGVWEVDGVMTIGKRVLMKERRFFRLQIDPQTGNVTDLGR